MLSPGNDNNSFIILVIVIISVKGFVSGSFSSIIKTIIQIDLILLNTSVTIPIKRISVNLFFRFISFRFNLNLLKSFKIKTL